ncbi:MAG: class I SAM-dependent methyltransferase [Woeseiaceae bacterium]|nr:class I SAM-dependent methyltransferase [Woeseiaceae bacterium]
MSSDIQNCCDFSGDYKLSRLPLIKKLEQAALDSDYGGTSWTTRKQVDAIIESLALHSGSRLLDIGSGAGWPGLLLAKLSQCDVTLLDIPLNALQQAAERAGVDQITGQVDIVSASGTSLPFLDRSFDRISHSDVLCCLPEKFELLQETRRVARDDGRMHFSVILPATDLSQFEYDEVLETGPPFVGVDGNYADLLRESGWQLTECLDVTEKYRRSVQRLVEGIQANEDELIQLLGADDLASRRQHREDQIALIERGLMRRETYAATAI